MKAGLITTLALLWLCGATLPWSAAAEAPAVSAAAAASAAAVSASAPPPLPLSLDRNAYTLGAARVGQPYLRPLHAEGGKPPYRFTLLGELPAGLQLDLSGRIVGTPLKAGRAAFDVRLLDSTGRQTLQSYELRVIAPGSAAAKASSPASAAALQRIELEHPARPAGSVAASAVVYCLDGAQLDALKALDAAAADVADPPPEVAVEAAAPASAPAAAVACVPQPEARPVPLPTGLAWSATQQAQLAQMLAGLFGREYPNRRLFESALDARLCEYVRELVVNEAREARQTAPDAAALARECPKPADAKVAKGSGTAVRWQDLPPTLMPTLVRQWLADSARREVALKPAFPLPWSGQGCGCLREDLQGLVYGFYPAWRAGSEPQRMDFSMLSRISVVGLPFDEDLALAGAMAWTAADTEFARVARLHGTQIDLTLYRRDWRFLLTEPDATREALVQRLVQRIPEQARELIDRPLPDLASRAQARLPGFGGVQRIGDGLSVYFEELPDPAGHPQWAQRFEDFLRRFMLGTAAALKQGDRPYVLNLVMTDRQIASPGPYDVAHLFELLKAIEQPELENGRLKEVNGVYTPHGRVELRFVVLLSEPTSTTKKSLRALVENAPSLHGGDRRIFLRKMIPVLMLPPVTPQQFDDDLAYFQDNFGGVGLWSSPVLGDNLQPAAQRSLANAFGTEAGSGFEVALCDFVCLNRWPIRLLFELLLVAGAVTLVLLQWNCDWRARLGRWALLGTLPTALIGAALLNCDPALRAARDGNGQLYALLAILVLATLYAVLKPKEDKP